MEEILNKRKSISATLDRIENEVAVLKCDDGQDLNWPVDNLPAGLMEGDRVKLVLFTTASEKLEREELAKKILNELLKTD